MTTRIAEYGRELARIWASYDQVDERASAAKDEPDKKRFAAAKRDLGKRRYALEALVLSLPAQTADDALVQIVVASSRLDRLLHSCVDEDDLNEEISKVQAVLYSAFAILERSAGIARQDLPYERYMSDRFNPHLRLEEVAP